VETVNVEITWKTMTLQRSGCSYKIDDLVRRKLVTKANGRNPMQKLFISTNNIQVHI